MLYKSQSGTNVVYLDFTSSEASDFNSSSSSPDSILDIMVEKKVIQKTPEIKIMEWREESKVEKS